MLTKFDGASMPVDSFLKDVENSVRQGGVPDTDPKFREHCVVSAEWRLDITVPGVRNALDTFKTSP